MQYARAKCVWHGSLGSKSANLHLSRTSGPGTSKSGAGALTLRASVSPTDVRSDSTDSLGVDEVPKTLGNTH